MIYCKKRPDGMSEVNFTGEGKVVFDEIATLLHQMYREGYEISPEIAAIIQKAMQEMVQSDSPVWNLQEICGQMQTDMEGHYDRLCRSARHFGLEAQKKKTCEEMRELSELLGEFQIPDKLLHTCRVEELADVYNMLDQLCILWDCEKEVKEIAEKKMIRTMERIESGFYQKNGAGCHT